MATVFPRSEIALLLNSNVVTQNVKDAISNAMKYAPVQTYLCQRNEWTPETFKQNNWLAIIRALHEIYTYGQENQSIQILQDWQNTGSQKEKFARSNHRKEPLDEAEYQEFSQCPMNYGEHEGPQHYLHCRMNPKPDCRVFQDGCRKQVHRNPLWLSYSKQCESGSTKAYEK